MKSVFGIQQVIGANHKVPLLNGDSVSQIFLDNAASTKPFQEVNDFIQEISPYYSNIHRGTGFDSTFCTQRYEEARQIIGDFVGWHPQRDVVIPVRNTTEGLNLIANTINFEPGDRIITTVLEHHSNDLPWRNKAQIDHLSIDRNGRLNLVDLEDLLIQARGRVKIVCVTGASNVTGTITPVAKIAAIAHKYRALIAVDGAQLIPHRRFNIKPHDDISHIDFLVFSGHKMNCPFGIGIVVGRKDIFQKSPPYQVGGGTVQSVSLDRVIWAETPHKQEAGTPNILAMLALARTIQVMEKIGMKNIEAHEQKLTALILQGFSRIPQIEVLGLSDPEMVSERVGVVSFTVQGVNHALVSAIMSYEWGIAVRHGCFCAQPLIKRLLNVTPEQEQNLEYKISQGNRENFPGAVRVSLGIHNTIAEVARLTEAVATIAKKQWQGDYRQDLALGEFRPQNYSFDFSLLPGFSPVVNRKDLEQTPVITEKNLLLQALRSVLLILHR
jgi:selenocysteine lyase/cysteine desulfurase